MKLSTFFALGFAAGAIYNLTRAEPDLRNALVGGTIAVVLFLWRALVTESEDRRTDEFFRWIEANRTELRTGRAYFRGVHITPGTLVRTYYLAVSCVVFTFKTRRRVYIDGVNGRFLPRFAYTLLSGFLGWWGIPWGPIYTIEALAVNLGGGSTVTVAELMHRERYVSRPSSGRAGVAYA